jgi:hypothetical protein
MSGLQYDNGALRRRHVQLIEYHFFFTGRTQFWM